VIGTARTSISLDVPQQVKVGTKATYAATVNPPGASIGTLAPSRTVEFLDAGKPISGCRSRSLAGGAATCAVSYANTGKHHIAVRYSGDANFGGSSSSTQPVTVISSGVVASTMSWTFGFNPTYTKVLQLTAYGLSSGITISVACHGHGCPFAKHTTFVSAPRKCGKNAKRKCSAPQTIDLTSIFHSHHLGVGAHIVVTITHSGWIGKHYRFTVRSGRRPLIQTGCLAVNGTRPGVGCSGS
jgi:Bacterial Ig-like domain (group 3)